ncbi:sensor histidine kinase [Nitrospirillum sp. BR 11163]|uniref:sensor histidine kinase n=1 Tax=Nitrospirillum sp. BR 11163 TaxID=3104323 RepID=UPI002B00200A|nr:ATP-binding protein [Nitrospirillum sp. BR 11163]MEA1674741.1 ATP-binding protein [Nitrospirillum sp. BR 11163]
MAPAPASPLRSSAYTLAFSYVLLGLVTLVLFAAPLGYAWRVTIDDGRTEILQEDAQRFTEVFRQRGPDGLVAFLNERMSMQIAAERLLLLTDAAHTVLAGNLPAWPGDFPERQGVYNAPIKLNGRTVQARLVHVVLPGGYHLVVARDMAHFRPLEQRFWYSLLAAMCVLLLLGMLGGFLIRRAVLRRIDDLSRTATGIVQGDLSRRLPTTRGQDEFNTLSRTINGMLDQIEQLVHGVRNVSNAIAHDLRTPLAELRSRLEEVSVTRPPLAETYAEVDGAVADVDRVIGIFNALLRLAEIDTGARRSGFAEVNVAEVAAGAVEFYLPAAELKGVSLTFRGDQGMATILGDPVLLAQAVGNLIDNALKFTPEGGAITVEVGSGADGKVEMSVNDNGPGIPDEEKPRVTERFYRGDMGRGTPGVGLGLSLVSAVAKLHGGTFDLADNHPGLKARMRLA